jgi:HrpA-like RNA helicase
MSTLPTLLRKGFVVPRSGTTKSEKENLKNIRSIDFVINFISDRIPIAKGSNPKIPAKNVGDKVIVLKSQTGSGKSTVLPPSLYENFQERTNKNIAVTQPLVLTAIDIPEGLPEYYPFLQLDDNLGYLTGEFKRKPANKGIIFMTIGTLLQQLKVMSDESFMNYYSFILIDEVHDRSVDIDMSLFLLKKFFALNYSNPECPMLILMSATFQPKIFMDYFGSPKENLITVIGSTFPIESNFLKYDSTDYIKYATDIAERIHITNISDIDEDSNFRDILIFVKGAGPVRAILSALHKFNANILSKNFDSVIEYDKNRTIGGGTNYYIAPIELTGSSFGLSGAEYQNLFSDIKDITVPIYKLDAKGNVNEKEVDKWVSPSRRIIVATNVAETGVTIETLKYCIDTGFVTSAEFNPDFGTSALLVKNITKGMAIQRKGRVGRKSPGFWYPCYTEDTFNDLSDDQFADILKTDITESILSIIIKETETTMVEEESQHLSKNDIKNKMLFKKHYATDNTYYYFKSIKKLNMSSVDFLETPSANSLNYSIEKLHILGFIDNQYNPTRLGMYAFRIRKVSMENRRLLFAGYSFGANILDLITIIAFSEIGRHKIFHRKYTPINMSTLQQKEYEFYYKILISDEMVEYILIWELFSEFLDSIIKKKSYDKFSTNDIKEWCLSNKLQYDGIIRIIRYRDELIESLISIGINPYYNGLDLPKGSYNLLKMFRQNNLDEFVDEVKKIKQCIYEGYRLNLCVWDNNTKKYILHYRNIPIYIKSNVMSMMGDNAIQRNPNFVVISNIMIRESMFSKGTYQYESSGSCSVLDQYISPDLNFMKH